MAITNFIQTVWSEKLLSELGARYVGASNCNREFEGDIKSVGDKVKICGIGAVNVFDYTKNSDMSAPETLDDTCATLEINRAKAFNFQIDDVDIAQSSPKLMSAAMSGAAHALANEADSYIFSLYNEQGLGCRTISMNLNREGDKTKYGNDWNARGVRRVLVNPIYCGVLVNHKYEIEDFLTGKQINIPKEEHFYHERPSWAIVPPEVFQKAQEIMESRRIKYDSGEPFREARYSSKHIFSTLIKCEHCGRSFTRKSYTYVNTRNYWRCVTNDQYTAEKCDNRVCLEEPELLEQLREYFASLITDKDAFIASILTSLDKQMPASQNPELIKKDIEAKRKKLLSKKDRYQEMYANDIMTIDELKDKVTAITEELKELDMDLEQLALSKKIVSNTEDIIRRYTEEIHRFLELETVTNVDMRRILDHISVDRDGHVRVVLKKFEDII